MRVIKYVCFILILSFSCTHNPYKDLEDKLRERKDANDPITVTTALKISHASYARGCQEVYIEQKKKKTYFKCIKKADIYLRDFLINILNQSGEDSSLKK